MINEKKNDQIMEFVHELTLRRHRFDSAEVVAFFRNFSIKEYLLLNMIQTISRNNSIYGGKTYLKELSEHLGLSITETSGIVKELSRRGILLWSHDGDGRDGTYVLLTDAGRKSLECQENSMRQFYSKVIEKFGKENLIELLQLMKQLDTIISGELEIAEEEAYYEELQSGSNETEDSEE